MEESETKQKEQQKHEAEHVGKINQNAAISHAQKPQKRRLPGNGFLEFLRGQGVVGLAIGFVIGTQMQVVVKQLLDSFINPFLGLIIGNGGDFSKKLVTIHFHGKTSQFVWGSFIYSLINFLLLVLVLYVIIKALRLDKWDMKI